MKDIAHKAFNIADLREVARRRLPHGLFEFIDRGAEDEVALRNNRAAFERIKLRPRNLAGVADRSLEVELFGQKYNMPIAIAPTGSAGLMWYQGEITLARAAAAAGIPCTLSTGSITPMEQVIEQAGGKLWFQTHMWPDRSLTHKQVARAKATGFKVLIVTVDGAVSSNREYNRRNGFGFPISFNRRNVTDVMMHPRWLFGVLGRYVLTTGMPRHVNYPSEINDGVTARPLGKTNISMASVNWDDLRDLRKIWPGPLIVKGILHPQDAMLIADCGVEGIIVSNHGARHLDSTQAPIEALPEIVDAVGKRLTVMVDSGFRRGSDVIKALALGAKAVLIGRPTLYGTSAAGEAGARCAIEIFRKEVDRILALVGCRRIAELNPGHLIMPKST